MSLLDNIFGSKAPAPATAPTTAAEKAAATNPTVPSSENTPPPGAETKSSLDSYSKLWDPENNTTQNQPLFNVDPAKFQETVGKMDFTKVIPAELLAKVTQGGEEGTAALLAAVNLTSQATFAQATQVTTSLVEQAVAKTKEAFLAEIPGMLKAQQVSESLRNENPIFSHPATAPILEAIKDRIIKANPTATAGEVTSAAKDYLNQFAAGITGPATLTASEAKAKEGEVDWAAFFEKG